MSDLKSRLEAKRDELYEQWQKTKVGAKPEYVFSTDIVRPYFVFRAGANEFIPMIVELVDALDRYAEEESSQNWDDLLIVRAKINAWLGGE